MVRRVERRTCNSISRTERSLRVPRLAIFGNMQLPRFPQLRLQTFKQTPSVVGVDTLVLSGGGIKGIAMLGAVAALNTHKMLDRVTTFVGVSVGSIVATVLAMKLDPRTVFGAHVLDFKYVADIDITRLDKTFGLDSGKYLEEWIATIVPDLTFHEFHATFGTHLVVVATDLNMHRPVYFSHVDTPAFSVRKALRMSCSIPLYFSAVPHDGHLYVDGGVSNNFPIEYATATLGSTRVFGIKFRSSPRVAGHSWTLETFLGSLVESNVNRAPSWGPARILELDTGGTNPTNFKISKKEKISLFENGYAQARLFVKKNH